MFFVVFQMLTKENFRVGSSSKIHRFRALEEGIWTVSRAAKFSGFSLKFELRGGLHYKPYGFAALGGRFLSENCYTDPSDMKIIDKSQQFRHRILAPGLPYLEGKGGMSHD